MESISKVKRLAEESGIPHLVWLARAAEARDFEREGRIADAICSYEGAIEEIERARSQRLTSGGRARYLEGKLEVYGQYIAFLHARTEARTHARWAEQALKIAEHAKARSLVESLPSLRRPPDTTLPAEVRARMDAILQNISRIQAGLLDPALPICERAGLFKALQENEDEWEDLHARLNGAGAILNKLVSPEEELQSLQENLRPGEIFLSYFLAERQSFVWAVDRSAVRMCALPSRQVLEGKVSSFRRLLTPPARRQGILSDMPGPGIALYKALIAPVAGEFALADRIMISPAGGLWYLPFEALSDGRSFLVERHHISYVPSASTLVALRRANSQAHAEDRPKTLLAVGAPSLGRGVELRHHVEHDYLRSSYLKCGFEPDPLPHAKNELRAIARLFPGSELRMDDLANEEWIKGADLTRYAYLHFATHGFPDEQQPERSALLLARSGNGREDGLLQVREIMSLKLDADLVVLSGCGTGLGQLVRGEGMLGLSFAFFSAGARSLVVALWDVRDSSTAAFMQAFYRGLRHGSPKAVALRQAKLSMLKSPRLAYRHPYFWAPFVLVGENT